MRRRFIRVLRFACRAGRRCLLLVGGLAGFACLGAQESGRVDAAWRLLASGRADEAETAFAELGESGAPEARLGEALAQLASRSMTPAQLGATLRTLEELGRTPGEIGVSAHYFAGRVREYHLPSANIREAHAAYAAVTEADAQSQSAEWVSVREAVRALYRASSPEEQRIRQAEAEALAARLVHKLARRNLHLQLGRAAERLELGLAVAYRHYREADRLGLAQAAARAFVLARLGELAALVGEKDEAIEYGLRFVAEFPRDERAPTVRVRLVEMEGRP